jgi:hypothetical protein
MELSLYTWNSQAINDGTVFRARILPGQMTNLTANPVSVPRSADFPFLSTTTLVPHTFVIGVSILPGQVIATKRELLKQYFNTTDKQRHNLIAKDTLDSNREWYLTGYPVRIAPDPDSPKNSFVISFAVETPAWRLVTAGSSTWNITASGQTASVTNAGNINVPPVFTITPTTTKAAGLSYRRWVCIYNNLDVSFNEPIDITSRTSGGGGFDTATLTTAKMQADGDDLRIWQDGAEIDRWLSGMDSATTQIWINPGLSPRHEGTLAANLANSGTAVTVTFAQTKTNRATLERMKKARNPVFLIGSEAFTYSPANVNTVLYQITSCSRAQKGTSYAAHTAGDIIRHIEHDTWILYGDSTLGAPDVDDDNKPMFDLDSLNTAWDYTYYYDTSAARPAAWQGSVAGTKSGLSYLFTGDLNAFADPATHLGMSITGSPSGYNTTGETATLFWTLSHVGGITGVTFSGSKYATNSWPQVAGLQRLQDNVAWFTESNQAVPSLTYTWETFGPASVSLASPYPKSVRFAVDGSLAPGAGEQALAEFDTVTVSIDNTYLPTVTIGAEASVNFFDFILTNNTSGDYIRIKTPCPVNTVLTVDCEAKSATLADGSRVSVALSSNRDGWLDLKPGANTLQFDDTGTVAVTVVTAHTDRTL